ncbi:phosphohydrolase [Rhizobium leguminosarum]|uniref:metallophosphoesterase n=1 Tax=Rhizobium leguminosarum TaxID=384 RepID=UPI001C952D10|nr:metallophosphoesterase [Rhizobium leguminosarum]MBY5819911.1 phosphohydrolase [Rhizobium leguminosarum]
MKAWVISDIHLFRAIGMKTSSPFPVPQAEVCILAGDVSDDLDVSLNYLIYEIGPHMPVVAVLGNHDYYGTSIVAALANARAAVAGSNVHLLENDRIELGGVRFIGATLWTDFEISVGDGDEDYPAELRLEIARRDVVHLINDFTEIRREGGGSITVDDLRERHFQSRAFITDELVKPFSGKTVVLTHHLPLTACLDQRYHGNLSNAAYASDLSQIIDDCGPDIWVHGHVHQRQDFMRGRTRIICNPRGMWHQAGESGYKSDLVIDL